MILNIFIIVEKMILMNKNIFSKFVNAKFNKNI